MSCAASLQERIRECFRERNILGIGAASVYPPDEKQEAVVVVANAIELPDDLASSGGQELPEALVRVLLPKAWRLLPGHPAR